MNWNTHPFSLRQLQYVVAVAENLSFSRAAKSCHVSQPALSVQLSQLEKVLGVRLFERDRRRVLVTTRGHAFIERARALLLDVDALVELARQSGDPLAGMLRIGVIPTISPYLLPRLSTAFRKAHARLTVRWVEDKTEVLVGELARGALDAALLAVEAEIGDVEREVLGFDPFVLATPAGHPLGEKAAPVRLAELRDASVLLLDDGHCFREQTLSFCASAKAHEMQFRATSLSTLAQMVAGGAGVTLLPQLAVATESKRADLRLRPFAKPPPGRTLALAWRRRSSLGPALRRLAATARAACRETSEPRRD